MMKTRSSLTAHEARFLTYVSGHPDTSFSELVNSQQSSVGIQDGFNFVLELLHRGLLETNAPALDFYRYCGSRIDITPAGTAALSAHREACAGRRRDTVWKAITLSVSSASLLDSLVPAAVSAVSAAVEFFF